MSFAAAHPVPSQACECPDPCADPFAQRYGHHLPRQLRHEAAGLTWQQFCDRYLATTGPIRLRSLDRGPTGHGRAAAPFEAKLAFGNEIVTATTEATGPLSALTAILYGRGVAIETLSFHQRETDEGIATFMLCERDGRRCWSAGIADSAIESQSRALIAAANRLAGR